MTALADGGARFIRGIEQVSFTVAGSWDDAATTGAATVLGGIRALVSTASFEYGPAGGASGAVKYSGEAWCTGFEVEGTVPHETRYRATFLVDGQVTVGTFA